MGNEDAESKYFTFVGRSSEV